MSPKKDDCFSDEFLNKSVGRLMVATIGGGVIMDVLRRSRMIEDDDKVRRVKYPKTSKILSDLFCCIAQLYDMEFELMQKEAREKIDELRSTIEMTSEKLEKAVEKIAVLEKDSKKKKGVSASGDRKGG